MTYTVVVNGPSLRFPRDTYEVSGPASVTVQGGVLLIHTLGREAKEITSPVIRFYPARPPEQVVYAPGAWTSVRVFEQVPKEES